MKWWTLNVFGKFDLAVEEGVRGMNEGVEMVDDDDDLEINLDVDRIIRASSDFWLNLKIKENMLIQKARLKWDMKARRNRNHIGYIVTDRGVIDSVMEVKGEVFNHFKKKSVGVENERPNLEGLSFPYLSQEERLSLECPFLEGEIKEEIWSCDALKSMGPDGYSFIFIKKC